MGHAAVVFVCVCVYMRVCGHYQEGRAALLTSAATDPTNIAGGAHSSSHTHASGEAALQSLRERQRAHLSKIDSAKAVSVLSSRSKS